MGNTIQELTPYDKYLIKRKGEIYEQLYLLGYNPEDSIRLFQTGPFSEGWDFGAHYLSKFDPEHAALLFVCDLHDRYNIDVKLNTHKNYIRKKFLPKEHDEFSPEIIAWIGRIYETWSRYYGLSSKEVYERLDFRDMYVVFSTGSFEDEFNFMLRLNSEYHAFKIRDDTLELDNSL